MAFMVQGSVWGDLGGDFLEYLGRILGGSSGILGYLLSIRGFY